MALSNGKQLQPSPDDGEVFAGLAAAVWEVNGASVTFAVTKITEEGGNRLVKRQRPYRNGAKVDNTGNKETVYRVETVWNNSIFEDGIQQNPVLYPLELNAMIDACLAGVTGNLTLPTRGKRRCQAESWSRTEDNEERDTARVSFTFTEDNEDNVDAQAFVQPSVRATARASTDSANFALESTGSFTQLMEDLENASTDLQDAIAAPGEALQDVDQKVARVVRLVDNIERQFIVTDQAGRDRLNDPDSWAAVRQLRGLRDRSVVAADEKSSTLPRIIEVTYDRARSLFDIAVELGQDPTALMNINTVENVLLIPARDTVRVFER